MESFSPYAVQPFSPLTTNFVRVLSKSEMTYEIFNHCISNILHLDNFVKDMVTIKFQNKKFKLMNGSKQMIGRSCARAITATCSLNTCSFSGPLS